MSHQCVIVSWHYRELVTTAKGKRRAVQRARELAEATGDSLEVWRIEKGTRTEHVETVHPANTVMRIVLVEGSGPKRTEPCPARDMYESPLTTRRLRLGAHIVPAHRVFILSAEHGLVPPDKVIEPHTTRLSKMTAKGKERWVERVGDEIRSRMESKFHPWLRTSGIFADRLRSVDIWMFCGTTCARLLRDWAGSMWSFCEPMSGLSTEMQIKLLDGAIKRAEADAKKQERAVAA
jgi:hypothetical protein